MKIVKYFFLFLLLASCDPPHNLVFINKSNSIAEIKIEIDSTIEYNEFRNFDELKADTLVYKIQPKDTCTLFFGIGTWSDDEVKNLAKSMKKLLIGNNDYQTIYKTKDRIEQILLENRDEKIGWENRMGNRNNI